MVETDLFFARYVDAVREQFELMPAGEGTQIVRTTSLRLKSRAAWVRPLLLSVGLKQVHRYVFRNWAATLRAGVYKSATTRAAASRSANAAAAAGVMPGASSSTR